MVMTTNQSFSPSVLIKTRRRTVRSPEESDYVISVFTELLDIVIPIWCTELAHGSDDISGEPLDV